jgi:hypothetical protein
MGIFDQQKWNVSKKMRDRVDSWKLGHPTRKWVMSCMSWCHHWKAKVSAPGLQLRPPGPGSEVREVPAMVPRGERIPMIQWRAVTTKDFLEMWEIIYAILTFLLSFGFGFCLGLQKSPFSELQHGYICQWWWHLRARIAARHHLG